MGGGGEVGGCVRGGGGETGPDFAPSFFVPPPHSPLTTSIIYVGRSYLLTCQHINLPQGFIYRCTVYIYIYIYIYMLYRTIIILK